MAGRPEAVTFADNGALAMVQRGNAGPALVNFSDKDVKAKMATQLPDGTYTDAVSGATFKVAKGVPHRQVRASRHLHTLRRIIR